MRLTADKCDRCEKIVLKQHHANSTDMVNVHIRLLYMGDLKDGETSRPSLTILEKGCEFGSIPMCPECLLAAVRDWVYKIVARGPSKIPPEHIIQGSNTLEHRCHTCHSVVATQ